MLYADGKVGTMRSITMTPDPTASRPVPKARYCGIYKPGHDMHHIQARLSLKDGLGPSRTVASVDDDGTITFTNGTTAWHHDPKRLRALLARHGRGVWMGTKGVLRVPCAGGAYCISIADEPTPCRLIQPGSRARDTHDHARRSSPVERS